jgi:hypothetical protein
MYCCRRRILASSEVQIQKLISLSKHEITIDCQDVSKKLGSQHLDLLKFALNTEDPGDIKDQVGANSTGFHKPAALAALQVLDDERQTAHNEAQDDTTERC